MSLANLFRFLSILLAGISMSAGFAHLFALPNKLFLAGEEYLIVQQIYRGWALLGIAVVGALASTLVLAVLVRKQRRKLALTMVAAACVALGLAVFFLFTLPANQQTGNWTSLPGNWLVLRRQWEYSHAAGAGLYFTAFIALTVSLLRKGE